MPVTRRWPIRSSPPSAQLARDVTASPTGRSSTGVGAGSAVRGCDLSGAARHDRVARPAQADSVHREHQRRSGSHRRQRQGRAGRHDLRRRARPGRVCLREGKRHGLRARERARAPDRREGAHRRRCRPSRTRPTSSSTSTAKACRSSIGRRRTATATASCTFAARM